MQFDSKQKLASSLAARVLGSTAGLLLLASGSFAIAGAANLGPPLPPGVPYASDSDPARFIAVVFDQTPHRGENVGVHVTTSSNVAAVTAQVGSIRVLLQKTGPGLFAGDARVPWWAHTGVYAVTFAAIRTDGVSTRYTLPVDVR